MNLHTPGVTSMRFLRPEVVFADRSTEIGNQTVNRTPPGCRDEVTTAGLIMGPRSAAGGPTCDPETEPWIRGRAILQALLPIGELLLAAGLAPVAGSGELLFHGADAPNAAPPQPARALMRVLAVCPD